MNTSPDNLKRTASAIFVAVLASTVFGSAGNSALAASPDAAAYAVTARSAAHADHPKDAFLLKNAKQIAFHDAMRMLWEDHMQWTYATIYSFFHNPTGVEDHLARLLQNQKDIGDAVASVYGKEAGDKMTALLTTHIQQAVPVLKAAQAGDTPALKKALDDWYANAQDIADFLSAANPKSWPASATRPMMKMHIDQTTAYAVHLLKGEYAAAVKQYGEARHHMIEMADVLSAGIMSQFPNKFQ